MQSPGQIPGGGLLMACRFLSRANWRDHCATCYNGSRYGCTLYGSVRQVPLDEKVRGTGAGYGLHLILAQKAATA